ncbi:MAG: curli production assembly/transport component CsgF [Balneolaceae bacterium]
MRKTFNILIASIVLALFVSISTVSAQEMVYQPKNPAFGGNPGNFQSMFQRAQTQNRFEEGAGGSGFQRDPLADFQSSLQRQVLSQLTRDIVNQQFGEGEIEERNFEFGEFSINVLPGTDGVEIIISNILTGDETSITVPSF